ncbi:TetR/AcrR family transcriptional regulator [Sporolactobacillus sp. Y61]|jgi:AcrR family transcriptional regulator|uniref:TetR/AcrR family transcriptional regulator n=1 Tax=Sporolactobacillus sp. Y61 TaxID=3160863 RepID=A0AAU8IHM2_9BACL|nr:TetR/AcrR family transcriptional regulator [Sporolactobacillus sp. THM19-2]RYL94094.1 TetR/AcrR family transcriptional regulator [Sporolactobacillus sp. THM19-2]
MILSIESKDRRAIKTRAAIRSHFLDLLLQKNFNQITVKDITAAANIGRGTFYLHYQDKYDLLDKVIEEGLTETLSNFQPVHYFSNGKIVPERIIRFARSIFDYFQKNERFFRAMMFNEGIPNFRNRMQQRFIKKFQAEVQGMILKNKETDQTTLEILPVFISSGMIGLIGWWFQHHMCISAEDMAGRIFMVMTRGPLQSMGFQIEHEQ